MSEADEEVEQVSSRFEQAILEARDNPERTELTDMVYGLDHVVEVLVDSDDEERRPTEITVGFDDEGYRSTGAVILIMFFAGWRVHYVVFSPYNRIIFREESGDV